MKNLVRGKIIVHGESSERGTKGASVLKTVEHLASVRSLSIGMARRHSRGTLARFFSSTAGILCNRVAGACYEEDRDLSERLVPLSARAILPTPTDLYLTYLPGAPGHQK